MSQVQPSHFVSRGTTVKNRFVNEDTGDGFRFYEGYVEEVLEHGQDENGTYACCSVVYEDGEMVKEEYLYDKDFENDESEDCWAIVSKDSLLLKWVFSLSKDAQSMKQAIASLQPLPESDVSESDDSSAYTSSEDSVYEVPTAEQGNIILDVSRVVLNIVASGFFLAYTYKLAIDYRLL